MAYRELQPLIKKAPSFRGVMSTTRYVCLMRPVPVKGCQRQHSIRFGQQG